jgi:hypothetical protein
MKIKKITKGINLYFSETIKSLTDFDEEQL